MKKKFYIILFVTVTCISLTAQNHMSDLMLMKLHKNITNEAYPKRSFLVKEDTKAFIKYNPVTYMFGSLMFLYQQGISPQFSAGCLYTPTCSEYSKLLINRYGIVKGILCTSDRLTRCNRISALSIHAHEHESGSHVVAETVNYYRW